MSHKMSYSRFETENGIFVITKPDAVNDLKSHSATFCLMIVSVWASTCYYIFFCTIKNSSKCEIYTCLQISCNKCWGDPFPFF